jgi:4-hydroxybenzoate polyprenyltransferase
MNQRKTRRGPLLVLRRLRVRDAIIFESPAIVAIALYVPALSPSNLARSFALALGGFLLMAHIFTFNDWADISLDHANTDKRAGSLKGQGFGGREILWMAAGLAVAGIAAVAAASLSLVPIALGMVFLGILYSFPISGLKAKAIPVISSLLHYAGIVLTFLLGSAAFAPIDAGTLMVGSYFGMLITAGHLVQEVQDYAEDRRAGIRTNAVQFGQRPMFALSSALFGLSFFFLVVLGLRGVIPIVVSYTSVLFALYAYWAVAVYRGGLRSADVRALRNRYRLMFAVVALVLFSAGLARLI